MKNPDPRRPNRNTLYLAMSGAGKSQALKQNQDIPATGVVTLLFDPNHDHECYRVRGSIGDYAATVAQGVEVFERTGRGCRLAWDATPNAENFELFCRVVNAALDGRRRTVVIAEELSLYNETTGKAAPQALTMMNTGRKFGLELHGTSQRPTEIPKTYYANCDILYIGRQKTLAACKAMAGEIDVEPRRIKTLPDLAFFVDKPGLSEPEYVQLEYRA